MDEEYAIDKLTLEEVVLKPRKSDVEIDQVSLVGPRDRVMGGVQPELRKTQFDRHDVVIHRLRDNGITVMHANHTVLMSVVAQRVRTETGVPYIVMPHGSALEFVLKRDERFRRWAGDAFGAAKKTIR